MTGKKAIVGLVVALSLIGAVQPSSATQGTGQLFLYSDAGYTQDVDTDEHGFFEVDPGETVYIRIAGLSETWVSSGKWVEVRVSYKDITGEGTTLGYFRVRPYPSALPDPTLGWYVGDHDFPIVWNVPLEAVPCFTYVVQYRNNEEKSPVYVASFAESSPGVHRPSHIHVVPEYPIGTLGAVSALLASLAAYSLLKRRSMPPIGV